MMRSLLRSTLLGLALGALLAGSVWAAPYTDSEIQAIIRPEEARVRNIRVQEINQLNLALKRRVPENRRADLYFRLAELYLEAYRAEFLLEGRAHEKRVERGARGTIDRSRSKPYLVAGVKACEQIIKIGLNYPRMDQVYYFLGVNYAELGKRAQANNAFTKLVTKYPRSEFASEAYRELGEDAFSKKRFREAQKYLQSAAQRARGDNLPRILHKLAWSYFRTKQYDQALFTMKDAIQKLASGGEKLISLKEEALRDIAVFFTEAGQVQQALRYFEEVAGDKEFYARALERLGKQYERSSDPKRATQVYEAILKSRPEDEAAFRVFAQLVETDLNRKQYATALKRLRSDVRILPAGDGETGRIAQNLRAQVRKTATQSHENYRKTKEKNALAVAEGYYRVYLDRFVSLEDPRNEKPEIQMYLADVLRERGASQEAASLYKEVINSGDTRYAKQAAQLWTAALADAIAQAAKAKRNAQTEPLALEREFVEAADALQDALGDQDIGREAALKAAQILAGYASTRGDALDRARRIFRKAPSTPQGLTAARLYLQTQIEGARLEDIEDVLKELSDNEELIAYDRKNGGKLSSALKEQSTRLEVGKIAASEKEQNFKQAAEGYEAFARKQTDGKLAEQAYANAVGSYTLAGEFDRVERVVAEWLRRFPKSPRSVDSVRASGTRALIAGAFEPSARLFERLGRTGMDLASLETAARIYEGLGDLKAARLAWERITKDYPGAASRDRAALALADSLVGEESSNVEKVQADFYRYCLGINGALAAECGAKLGDLYTRMKDLDQAQKYYKQVAALGGKGKRARSVSPYVGYARYRVAEMLERSKRFEPLSLPEAKLRQGLQARLEFLEPLSRAYTSAVEAGGPWALAALNRLARFAWAFADEMDRLEPPSGTEASIQQFRQSISSVSAPLRLKAYETWKKAFDQAQEQEILSPAIIEIGDALADGIAGKPALPRAQGPRMRYRLSGAAPDAGRSSLEEVRKRLTQNAKQAAAWVDYGNLLWGEGKPGLARLAYDRALALAPQDPAALNNRSVVELAGRGQDEWVTANSANDGFKQALAANDFFLTAKINRAALLNYYRVFPVARKLWEQVLVKASSVDAYDGLAIALTALGSQGGAEAAFKRADEAGGEKRRFARVFHDAAKRSRRDCLDRLGDMDASRAEGFEKKAIDSLRIHCSR